TLRGITASRLTLAESAEEKEDSPNRMARDVYFSLNNKTDLFLDGGKPPTDVRKDYDPAPRQKRQFDQLVNFTQKLLRESGDRRDETFWSKLDKSSLDKYQ